MRHLVSHFKNIIRKRVVSLESMKRPALRYCIHNELLPELLSRTPSNLVRTILNLPPSEYQTQLNQDIFALLMSRFKTGFFLEIGANDGFTHSNTVYLEREFGWNGILVEANNKYLPSLALRKNSVVVNKAVSFQKGTADFIDAGLFGGLKSSLDGTHIHHTHGAPCITVDCMTLQEILDNASAPARIDFVSIDVEGGEMPVVEQMVSVDRRFGCGCIEYNWRENDRKKMAALLENNDYRVVWQGQTEHDLYFVDTRQFPVGQS